MEIILINKNNDALTIENGVIAFKRNKINYHGRKQWCYICYLKYFTKAYPCNQYDIYTITSR